MFGYGKGRRITLPAKRRRTYTFREVIIILAAWSLVLIAVMDWLMP